MIREIVLDTETTGLRTEQGHKLIEICAMEVINGVATNNFFHHYINPQREVPAEAFAVHGIATEFLLDKPLFKEIANLFLEFIADSKLIIHNAKFDVGFLNYELAQHGNNLIKMDRVIDTLIIARKKFPGSPASLDALCKRFKINLATRHKHGAMIDVELLYQVYQYLNEAHVLIKTEKKDKDIDNNVYKNKQRIYREPRNFPISEQENLAHQKFMNNIINPIWNN